MASLTVSAPCNISSASSLAGMKVSKPIGLQHKVVMMNNVKPVKASSVQSEALEVDQTQKKDMQRRSVLFAAAAAAVSAVSGGIAMAGPEPKPGSPEAKKLYARICVTMPTAKVCHN